MMQRANGLVAKYATLPIVPLRDNIPDQTVCGIGINLLQAVLTAVLALGPAGAGTESECRLTQESAFGGLFRIDIHGYGFVGLGADYETLATVGEVGAHCGDGAEGEECHRQRDNSGSNDDCEGHRRPPRRRGAHQSVDLVWFKGRKSTVPGVTGRSDWNHTGVVLAR